MYRTVSPERFQLLSLKARYPIIISISEIQAIDIIFQVWEHAQKSKFFLPNKACFLILFRIVFNFLNKK